MHAPLRTQHVDAARRMRANERLSGSATTLLNELVRWAIALRPLRAS